MGKARAIGSNRGNSVDALNAEWHRLVADGQGRLEQWQSRNPALGYGANLIEILDHVIVSPDDILGPLLLECRSGDQLAGRVVLQAMLGKMVRMAARDKAAGVDDYISALWLQIVTYPVDSRPFRIAANLALDTLKAVTSERRSRRHGEVTPYPPEFFLQRERSQGPADRRTGRDDLDARRVIEAASRLGLLNSSSAMTLTKVYADGLSGEEAALFLGTSPGAVRCRCSTSVARLARHAVVLADAA